MPGTVYLHVGIAKTGTTYVQRTLFANRALLERHGTRYPGDDPSAQFFGSLDLRGVAFKGHVYDGVAGAWGRLVALADEFEGTALISHETLAHATSSDIERAVASFATDDVRVVITCRDLARQIPAVWQEILKNRVQVEYDEFLAQILPHGDDEPRRARGFWRVQDVASLAARWGEVTGVGRVTLVTVPPQGADRLELWRRFAQATGLPDIAYRFPEGDNSSLGVAEAELLRRLNPMLGDDLDWPRYDALIKKGLAENVLGRLDSHGRLTLPARWRADVAAAAASEVATLARSGFTVVGDLHDLEPASDEPAGRQPAELDDSELLDAALHVVAILATESPAAPKAVSSRSRRVWRRTRSASRRAVRAIQSRLR